MVNVFSDLWIGKVEDLALIENSTDFSVLGVCKEPLHRRYARLKGSTEDGYLGRAMPKDEPEYLYAKRGHALYCNLIDSPNPDFISDKIIEVCMNFIDDEMMNQNREVLIVCNKAESRSPSIALMYLIRHNVFKKNCTFDEVVNEFKRAYYPLYNPGKGFYEYTKNFWEVYKNGKT